MKNSEQLDRSLLEGASSLDPEDNFNPPLRGIITGQKYHRLLLTLRDHEAIEAVDYLPATSERAEVLVGALSPEFVDGGPDEGFTLGTLNCRWWSIPLEPDWFRISYIDGEVVPVQEGMEIDEEVSFEIEGDKFTFEISDLFIWGREENDEVTGSSFFAHYDEDGNFIYEPWEPEFDSPEPLIRSILDHHLPKKLEEKRS